MSELAAEFGEWAEAVTVETFLGTGSEGDAWADPVPVEDVIVDRKRRMIRTSDGAEAVSESTIYVDGSQGELFALRSRVTIPGGAPAHVLKSASYPQYGMFDHVVVNLE
jgi:hypothetical protein